MKSNILLVDVNILGRGGDGVPNANKYSSQVIWPFYPSILNISSEKFNIGRHEGKIIYGVEGGTALRLTCKTGGKQNGPINFRTKVK